MILKRKQFQMIRQSQKSYFHTRYAYYRVLNFNKISNLILNLIFLSIKTFKCKKQTTIKEHKTLLVQNICT